MSLDQVINLLVTVTLIEMMTAVGLEFTVADLAGVARDWSIFYAQFPLQLEIRPRGLVGMAALLGASAAAGWLPGGPASATRRAAALTTALRNVGVGLVITSGAFAGPPALTAAVAYGLFEVAGALLLALLRHGREAAENLSPR